MYMFTYTHIKDTCDGLLRKSSPEVGVMWNSPEFEKKWGKRWGPQWMGLVKN